MWRRAALAAALLAAACSPAASSPAVHTASPTSSSSAVGAALSAMYTNHYSDAAREFQAALAGSDAAQAAAGYALLLNYAGRQDDAHVEAGLATAVAPRSGYAFAVLCRVHDWAQEFSAAVAAGRTAARLSPSEPSAHLFLAEALADTGALDEATAEIATAKRLVDAHPTPFLRAEVLREQGNLAGDRGDDSAKLAAFKSALAEQPAWLYRTSEVIDAQSGAEDMDGARQTLASVVAAAPADPLVLATLGNEAISVDDEALAMQLWQRAAALAPEDPRILVGAGAIAVAAAHDNNMAVTEFQAALRVDPGNVEAAGYLLALARFARHDPASGQAQIDAAVRSAAGRPGQRIPAAADPAARLAANSQRALAAVNAARAAAGLPVVRLDARLATSALSHSYYWLFNNLSDTVSGLGIHQESPGLLGYSGRYPWDRAVAFGYPNERIGEDIDHRGDPVDAVDDWVNSVYHRFSIVRPDLEVIGYGEAAAGPILMEDLEFGFAATASGGPVLYPGAGQRDVPAMFVDNELPDPVPTGQPRSTGSPVTVTFAADDAVRVASFTVSDASGRALPAYSELPSDATENSAWLLPHQPFDSGATYTAHIVATVNGQAYDRTWSFTTA